MITDTPLLSHAHRSPDLAPDTTDDSPTHTVIGVDFGGTKTELALADPHGAILVRKRLATMAERGPDQAIARAAKAVRQLAAESETRFDAPVAAHAAVAPGIIQPERILLTPNLPGWEGLALSARLADEFGVPTVPVANDVRAGALAELRLGELRGAEPGLYVNLGTGLAAALTVGGNVVYGANQAAGEIAYANPGNAPLDAVSAGRAPLEEILGGKNLTDRARALLGESATGGDLFRSTDPAAQELAGQTLTALATALANMAVLVDPSRIVLGGGLMSVADLILPQLERLLAAALPFPTELRVARFRQDASLYGAIVLAMDSRPAPVIGPDFDYDLGEH
ncbi:ROK family protein [Streptomyces sp. NRRL WC-3742]|uniref:ROK family protein n=1 Tax=Streptomyces sp. NRRL WC-3742 TaxID=1463934 RepID=UPI00068C3107|nr:ROK family protein [Streptomyces sp. NRRL WC-3742]